MRVRTTSSSVAPACASADAMFAIACFACAYASPAPTMPPLPSVAVVPDTKTRSPTTTARE